MGVKSADQDATGFEFEFMSWLEEGGRMSDVMVGNGASSSSSSPSSQRSTISGGDDFGALVVGVLDVGLVKKEESFDWPVRGFLGLDVSEVSVRRRLRDE
jgi:hypothetical protein